MKKFKHIFSCTDVTKLEILINIIRLICYKVIGRRCVIKTIHSNKMVLDLSTPGISKTLFLYGKRELLETWVVEKEVKNDMHVLDVGANIGYYALLEASMLNSGKVYAFEPDPRNIKLLKDNIKLNDFCKKIEVYPYAVGREGCITTFHQAQRTNLSRVTGNIEGDKASNLITVKCIRLDDFRKIDDVDFIRMDIEGYECMAVDGMSEFLKRTQKPIKFMMEVHPYLYGSDNFDFGGVLNRLDSLGFYAKYLISAGVARPKMITDRGYEPIKTVSEGSLTRGLYRDIRIVDLLSFLDSETKLVRAICLEKKV